jgi:hypothetical protein
MPFLNGHLEVHLVAILSRNRGDRFHDQMKKRIKIISINCKVNNFTLG